jgi:hypothetical protein
VEFEADDALATGAALAETSPGVEQVVICSPDKDLAQCVRGTRVVCLDRMRRRIRDEAAVRETFGIGPASITDWLALVGDDADGIPGVPRWGARSAWRIAQYEHLEAIPDGASDWKVAVRGRGASPFANIKLSCSTAARRSGPTCRCRRIEDRFPAPRRQLTALCGEIGSAGFSSGYIAGTIER